MSSADTFFTQKNEAMLQRVLYTDICRRTGGDLNEKQASRLMKTVKHYMTEVHRVQGNKSVSVLNKEVLQVVLPDYMMYINRSSKADRSEISDIEEGPVVEEPKPNQKRLQLDLSTAFSQMQVSRQETKAAPTMNDFRISLQDEEPVSMDTFERMKTEREQETMRAVQQQQQLQQQLQLQSGQANFAEATEVFSRDRRQVEADAEAIFAERERKRLEVRASTVMPVPTDMRALFFGDKPGTQLSRTMNQPGTPAAAGNPTIALGNREREVTGGLQQMIITREPETMAYKENENNLFIYSGDRNWVTNSTETRYNFSVTFDPANLPTGQRLSPTSTVKFKNITRIEFVKAIMPGEGLDMLVTRTTSNTYDTSLNMNILSYPYIQLNIPELDTNTYGTNQGLNAAFAVLQYDANWVTDTNNTQQRGYLAMIPKFLKCQKVYQPTPLSTLQKLTFNFQRPDGTSISTIPDTLNISQIYPSFAMNSSAPATFTGLAGTVYRYDSTVETNSSAYYWLQTSTYFNHWTVSKGDRILVNGLTFGTEPTGSAIGQVADFLSYIQTNSLVVVDTGTITGSGSNAVFVSGNTNSSATSYNSQGYANAIIVRGKFVDPTLTGSNITYAFANTPDSYTSGNLSFYLVANPLTAGRLLNQSHQVHIAMRVITRELDATGLLRPDNM